MVRRSSNFLIGSLASLILLSSLAVMGQAYVPANQGPAQDPLMSLMLSQPKIDVDSPVQPTANFDPALVRPGERVTYRVVLNALEASIEWPDSIPNSGSLNLVRGAHGQLMAMAGVMLAPTTTFNYHTRVTKPGRFTIPAFTIQVYGKPVTIPEAQLEVRSDLPASLPPPAQLILDLPTNNVFAGQAVRARVFCPSSPGGAVQGLAQVQIMGDGFIVDASTARARVDSLPDRSALGVIHELTLTPIASGKLSAYAQGYSVGNGMGGGIVISGPGIIPGTARQYTLLDSDLVEFAVRPLPREGELPGFTGGVGRYVVENPQFATNFVRVGDPIKLSVRVRGEGNLVRLVPPPPPKVRGWQIFSGSTDATHPQIIMAQGFTTFTYTLVPLDEHEQATPQIPFSFFDPVEARYVDASIASVPFTIGPGAVPVDLAIIEQAQNVPEPEEKAPTLSGLASRMGLTAQSLVPLQRHGWFPLVQLAPAFGLLGLWSWDRRRRFFELHPDVLLRKRASRALRRERKAMDRACRAGDAQKFAYSAVSALRVACSPHYPAEPRALVGRDVLAVLPSEIQTGPEGLAVRRLFESTDAKRFSDLDVNGANLLESRSELYRVLERLEARL